MEAFIVDAVRSPRGKKKGSLVNLHPMDLLARTLNGLMERNQQIPKEKVEDVIMGCVTQVGEQSWNVARGAVLAAGWPENVPGTTINRFCGSGQQAVHFAAQAIKAGSMDLVVAGGVESMHRVKMGSDTEGGEGPYSPMLLARYPDLVPQGESAEMIAEKWKLSREAVDQFALESQRRAARAREESRFSNEILPLEVTNYEGEQVTLAHDEHMRPATTLEGLGKLRTVFKETDGVVTAGNASGIVDGASAVLIASKNAVSAYRLKPRARIDTMYVTGSEPRIMLTGPIPATRKALERAGLGVQDIDLFEVNEAFASVPLAWAHELEVSLDQVNVNGGAIALGHPLGATGGMLFATLLNELERRNLRRGLVTMCIGYGMGTATIIDRDV